MLAVPGLITNVLGTVAARFALEPNCVGRVVPFHSMTEALVKPVPLARSVNPLTPATTQFVPPRIELDPVLYGAVFVSVMVLGGGGCVPPPLLPPPQPDKVKAAKQRTRFFVSTVHLG